MDSVNRIGHWDHQDFDWRDFDSDNLKMRATLDVQSLVSEFVKSLHEKEDAVLEPIVVDWLRERGVDR